MELYHLSHIDLDGYACQVVSQEFFKKTYFFNANYGEEVMCNIRKILQLIEKSPAKKIFLLVTDVNLTDEESAFVDAQIHQLQERKKAKITLQLLDHHKTGQSSADRFDWYYLDVSRSATKITFDYLMEHHKILKKRSLERLRPMVEVVNAIDIWLEDEPGFEFGKVLMRAVGEAREVSRYMFPDEAREYIQYILKRSLRYINKKEGHIQFDDALHKVKKKFLMQNRKNDTLDNLRMEYNVVLLEKNLDQYVIDYRGHTGCLTFTIGAISVIANAFLSRNPEFHFFMEIGPKGNCSMRAKGELDVSEVAQKLFGGGGHANAAGGRIDGFKETFDYGEVKSQLQKIITEKA